MKFYSKGRFVTVGFSVLVAVLLVVSSVSAATTISTDIVTGGALTVTGLSSLTNASTTLLSSTGDIYVNGFASTTAINGNFATKGTLGVTGLSTLTGGFLASASSTLLNFTGLQATTTNATSTAFFATTASSTNLFAQIASFGNASTSLFSSTGDVMINGFATTSAATGNIATKGSLTVGPTGRAVNNIVYGYCSITNSSAITASTSANFTCTTDTVGNVTASHRVFVQATSSLPSNLYIQAASSTAADTINLQIFNYGLGTGASTAPGAISINYFAVK